ncbi:MAG: hypothetical protein LLF94_10980 [Chlamydiales bacterium]|nr:hypothetical protein [Chlamydiales bacterium]
MLKGMTFDEFVLSTILQKLSVEFLLDEIKYGLLRDTIEACFLAEGFTIEPEAKAVIILDTLFGLLVRGFSFKEFVAVLPPKEKTRFISILLYQIYYLNLTLEHLVSKETLYFYLLRTLALEAPHALLDSVYKKMDIDQRLRCLDFCLKNFDEGSYRILQIKDVPDINKLLELIDKKLITNEIPVTEGELKSFLQKTQLDIDRAVATICKYIPHSQEEVLRFCTIYGLYDHQVPKEAWSLHKYASLPAKLAHCTKRTRGQTAFIKAINAHITATADDYKRGVELITYALPTAGKDLSLFAWLESITRAIEAFCNQLKIENTIPLFIFDQSSDELFNKNATYCKSVSPNCLHIGTEDLLKIADKIGIRSLLETDSRSHFGYGGARNTIFLLMPLCRYYLKESSLEHVISYMLTLSDEELRADFKDVVLTEGKGPCVIHMGDDDVHVPYSTIFSDALFALQHKNEYFCRFGWQIGRKTTWTETSFNLEYILEHTSDILLQHSWQKEPFRHGMAGLLSKPKLCLNVPFGQEEAYLLAMKEYVFDIRQPMLHLSGYRFPKVSIPQNRFAGLAAHLKGHYSYSIGSMLVSDLLDPLNYYKRLSLPWNQVKTPFTSLANAIECITDPKVVKKMQKSFSKNLVELNEGLKNYKDRKLENSNLALFHIGVLDIQNVPKLLAKYQSFTQEVQDLTKLFANLKQDSHDFKQTLSGKGIEAKDALPITHALQLLTSVIQTASFQAALKTMTTE